jgi:zinc transport system permease protein
MTDQFFELFQYRFFSNALLASLLHAINCGIIGTYIVTRRLVFISGGLPMLLSGNRAGLLSLV